MKIKINDATTEIPEGLTITDLLANQKVKMPDMVSVQVNETIVERDAFSSTKVQENDSVDFLYFMGGGREEEVGGGRREVECDGIQPLNREPLNPTT